MRSSATRRCSASTASSGASTATLWRGPNGSWRELAKELDAAKRAGLLVEEIERAPLPFDTGPCLRFGNQAEFHPLAYIRGLAEAIVAGGGRIVTGVHVTKIAAGSPVYVELETGRRIRAATAVDATNMTITSRFGIPTREAAYRTYIVALDVEPGYVPHGLYWDPTSRPLHPVAPHERSRGADRRRRRPSRRPGRSGNALAEARGVGARAVPGGGAGHRDVVGQVQEPVDGLAYIGALPGHEHVFVVTGDWATDSRTARSPGCSAGADPRPAASVRASLPAGAHARWAPRQVHEATAARWDAPYADWMRARRRRVARRRSRAAMARRCGAAST